MDLIVQISNITGGRILGPRIRQLKYTALQLTTAAMLPPCWPIGIGLEIPNAE